MATRLQEEEIIWLTTVRADGRPQSVPVWALWDGETFLIYSKPDQPKTRNIAANPRVSLNLNSNARGGDIVASRAWRPWTRTRRRLAKYRSI
ncbi:MAG: pyridoxamine 5'-phosphate oxidase family protein [Chloroflexia bacterium]